MSSSKLFTDYAVKLHAKTAQAAAAKYVDSVQSVSLNGGLQTTVRGGDGLPYNTHGSLTAGAPAAELSTLDLKAFLDECGAAGMAVDADGSHPGVVLYFQKYAEGGTREAAAASSHCSVTVPNGILVPTSLEMAHGQDAVLSATLTARKEGVTAPLTFDEAADLPSGVYPTNAAVWSLGPVDLNGTALEGIQNLSVDFGLEVLARSGDGDVYPTLTSIGMIQPSITITADHIDITSVLTEDGKYYTAEQLVFYARKRAEGGTFVADGTAEHIKFTLGKCRADWTSIQGQPKQIALKLTPWYTNAATPVAPIAIATASAIT